MYPFLPVHSNQKETSLLRLTIDTSIPPKSTTRQKHPSPINKRPRSNIRIQLPIVHAELIDNSIPS